MLKWWLSNFPDLTKNKSEQDKHIISPCNGRVGRLGGHSNRAALQWLQDSTLLNFEQLTFQCKACQLETRWGLPRPGPPDEPVPPSSSSAPCLSCWASRPSMGLTSLARSVLFRLGQGAEEKHCQTKRVCTTLHSKIYEIKPYKLLPTRSKCYRADNDHLDRHRVTVCGAKSLHDWQLEVTFTHLAELLAKGS